MLLGHVQNPLSMESIYYPPYKVVQDKLCKQVFLYRIRLELMKIESSKAPTAYLKQQRDFWGQRTVSDLTDRKGDR